MCRRLAIAVALIVLCWAQPGSASLANPSPLRCDKKDKNEKDDRDDRHGRYTKNDRDDQDDKDHKDGKACPLPAQCQLRVSDHCVNGQCPAIVNAPDGTSCDDGNPATTGDACRQGVCGGGLSTCPPTGNPCTVGVRQPTGACLPVNVADGTACNDGNACTTGDACTQGVCGGAAVQCSNGGNPCTIGVCQANGSCGLVNVTDGTGCNDGNACTTGDVCSHGVCAGAAVQCPGGDACTFPVCKADGSCGLVNLGDGTPCDDGDACTTGSTCQAGVCAGGSALTCASPTDSCQTPGGCATDCGAGGCAVSGGGPTNPTLNVPPGALDASVRIKITDLGGDPSDPSVFHVYELGPSGTQFAPPATIDLPAPPLAPGHTAVIELNSGSGWVAIPTTLNAGRVSGPVAHFSGCRTRDVSPGSTADLEITDMVEFQDLNKLATPFVDPLDPTKGTCDPGFSLFGICFKVKNPTAATVPSAVAHIYAWQCYNGSVVTGPTGEQCLPTSLLIPCTPAVDLPLPAIGPGQEITFTYNLEGNEPFGCLGSSFVGVDVTLREPTLADPDAGMRSANVGPLIDDFPPGPPFHVFFGKTPPAKPRLGGGFVQDFLIDARF